MIGSGLSVQRHFFENAKPGDKFYWYEKNAIHNPYSEWNFTGRSDEVVHSKSKTAITFKETGLVPRIGMRSGIWVPTCEHEQWLSDSERAKRFIDLYDRLAKLLPGVLGQYSIVLSPSTVGRLKERRELLMREVAEIEWILNKAKEHKDLRGYVERN